MDFFVCSHYCSSKEKMSQGDQFEATSDEFISGPYIYSLSVLVVVFFLFLFLFYVCELSSALKQIGIIMHCIVKLTEITHPVAVVNFRPKGGLQFLERSIFGFGVTFSLNCLPVVCSGKLASASFSLCKFVKWRLGGTEVGNYFFI